MFRTLFMNFNYCIFNNNTNKKTIKAILLNAPIRTNSEIVIIVVLKCLNCCIFYYVILFESYFLVSIMFKLKLVLFDMQN